ncbi:GNAT family N-acetyltransferase [Sphingomonas sp.]|uniref:GNAT family N-acetyltransferase n=1 Tax=Sphingomonas sp. TaxID=28214 RepID=UPI0025EBB30F|nr:GNAT family N-acetyltransferase [Sphingomonas sp.]
MWRTLGADAVDDWSQYLTTRTGFRFHVRPARPADEGTLAEFFTHVTRDDLRFRFLTGLNEVGHDRIAALATVDHKQTENFLAFDEHGSTMIATAMLACDPALDRGEVAISIRNDYKHRGISWELLAHIARFAEAKGVKTLESIESRENHAAIELEREMGFTAEPYPGDPTLILVRRTLDQATHA